MQNGSMQLYYTLQMIMQMEQMENNYVIKYDIDDDDNEWANALRDLKKVSNFT